LEQILEEGFYHSDPHEGRFKWSGFEGLSNPHGFRLKSSVSEGAVTVILLRVGSRAILKNWETM
jgi:hypothetical protein